MTDHYAVHLSDEFPEDGEFVFFHGFARALYHRKLVMRVEGCGSVTWEMLAATKDTRRAQGSIERFGIFDNLRSSAAVAATSKGVVRFIVEGNVKHRAEIEIEAEQPQQSSSSVTMPTNEPCITPVAELAGVWRLVAEDLQARNPTAFLVNGDDGFGDTQIPKIVNQFAKLRRRLDISPEQDVSTRLELSKASGSCGVEFSTGNAYEQELTGIAR